MQSKQYLIFCMFILLKEQVYPFATFVSNNITKLHIQNAIVSTDRQIKQNSVAWKFLKEVFISYKVSARQK